MKINISTLQYKRLVQESINRGIVLEGSYGNSVSDDYITTAKEKVGKALNNKLTNNSYNIQAAANELGINPNYDENERGEARRNIFKSVRVKEPNAYVNQFSPQMTEKVKQVIAILQQIVTKKEGNINLKKLQKMVDNNETYGMSYNEVMTMKDFIDAQSLRYMYDKSAKPTDVMKFGNQRGKNGIDTSNFDLNNITDAHIYDWLKSPSRKEAGYTEANAFEHIQNKVLTEYLDSTYGIQMKIPNFSLGNNKVKDALLINFTSAFRCPAWNECLVKHACYARAGEVRHYENEKLGNDRKNLMWIGARKIEKNGKEGVDEEFLRLIEELLRAYVVDYSKVKTAAKGTSKEIRAEIRNINMSKLPSIRFSELSEGLRDIISQCTRVKDIRLNENGDFIGQWLLDAFDNIAGDFALIGVNTAAYSCRNLKFEKIKNIVINASRKNMKGDAIARYFYALPVKMYDAFEDTYGNMSISDQFNAIERIPQPLYGLDGQPNGNYYYKCPCGRKDFSNLKGKSLKKVNCYQCHLCYEQPDEKIQQMLGPNGRLFVFVKAHGAAKNLLNAKREIQVTKDAGVCQGYKFGQTDDGKGYDTIDDDDDLEAYDESIESKPTLNESVGNPQDDAIQSIANNCISSMREHFAELAENPTNTFEGKKVKNDFKQLMERINKCDKTNKGEIFD